MLKVNAMVTASDFLEDLLRQLQNNDSLIGLQKILRNSIRNIGFKHVVYYLPIVPGNPDHGPITIMTYPKEWVEHYLQQKYFTIDPIISVHAQTFLPIDWNELPRSSKRVKNMFDEAKKFGVGTRGLTVPVRGRFNETAIFSVTSDANESEWQVKKKEYLPHLHFAAHFVHQNVLKYVERKHAPYRAALSPREKECLSCLVRGMRDVEIAQHLGISRRVVSAYVETLRYKLGATTRANAIAIAHKMGLVS